jgi:hypothetical protein
LVGVSEQEVNKKSFLEAYFDFGIDYERANPITRKKGFENYLGLLLKKDVISSDEHAKLVENLNSQNTVNILEVYYNSNMKIDNKNCATDLRNKVMKNLQMFGLKDISDIFKIKVGTKKVSIFDKYKKKKGIGKENAYDKEQNDEIKVASNDQIEMKAIDPMLKIKKLFN